MKNSSPLEFRPTLNKKFEMDVILYHRLLLIADRLATHTHRAITVQVQNCITSHIHHSHHTQRRKVKSYSAQLFANEGVRSQSVSQSVSRVRTIHQLGWRLSYR
jgi:hypothetical protein